MKKILIVDNNKVFLRMLTHILEKMGHEALTAENGHEALKTIASVQPDLMFVDLIMPVISGEKLCKSVRKIPQFNSVPIVIITAIAAEEEIDFASFGADACIAKGPMKTMEKHIATVIELLDSNAKESLKDKIFGKENIFEREITKELLANKKHFEIALNNMVDGYLELTDHGHIVFTNRAACALLKTDADTMLGLSFADLFPENQRQMIADTLDRLNGDVIEIGEDGSIQLHGNYLNLKFISYLENDQRATIAFVQDISKRKHAEKELKKAHHDLEEKVVERTKELKESYEKLSKEVAEREKMERQMIQAHKTEAIGTMAGGIAHDFNNILAAVIGYAELAQDDIPDSSPAVHHIEEILSAGRRAKNLVRHILSFSRVSDQSNSHIPINLSFIVKEVLEFQRAIIPTTIEIQSDIDLNCGQISGEPAKIHQLLMNLCTNASCAMEKHGGTLGIELHQTELSLNDLPSEPNLDAGRYIRLSVSDTGPGMTSEVIDRIFDPYFTTKETGKGSGMGLAVVLGIVKNHGGFMKVESTPDNGSTFNVFFPKVIEAIVPETDDNTEDMPTGSEKILFIDDEAMLADVGRSTLERLGYVVTSITDSAQALALLQSNPSLFDLVITDQTMPNICGTELAKQLLEIRPDLPIILCTGYSSVVNKEEAQKVGIRGFALKPVDKKILARLIRQVLKGNAST